MKLTKHQQLLCGAFVVGQQHQELMDFEFLTHLEELHDHSPVAKICFVTTERLSDEWLEKLILDVGAARPLRIVSVGKLETRGRDVLRDSPYHYVIEPRENSDMFETGALAGNMSIAEAIVAGAQSVQTN